MKNPFNLKWKTPASLACVALLACASTASATLVTLTDNTNNPTAFTPAWPLAPVNLISNLLPTDSFGTFTQESAAGPAKLTDGIIGPVQNTGNNTADHAIFATVGNNGGRMVIYDLPATAANGYNITNVSTFTAWGNGGRHAQAYTLYYATKASPRKWIQLGTIVYSGGFTGNNPNQPSANRVIWTDTAGAPFANNVAAIMFDFNTPTAPNGYNGYVGLSEITVEGTASSTVVTQAVTITKSNTNGANPFNPNWNIETNSLIAGMIPTTTNGNFGVESPTALGTRDVGTLTTIGNQTLTLTTITANNNNTTSPNYVTCGGGSGAGSTIIYTLTNSINGCDLTNIVVYNGWADNGRFGQFYTVSYSTVAQPTTFSPISTVYYLPSVAGSTPSANRVAITSTNGIPLGTAVANIKFDFSTATSLPGSSANPAANAFNNGYQGYLQIIVQGTNTAAGPPPPSAYLVQDTLPNYAETVIGDQVVFSAAYSNSPPANVQWLFVSGGVTNVLANQTNSTLTLNNVQTNNTGTYILRGDNATNGAALPSFSTGAPLVVGTNPAALGNVIVKYASQNFPNTTNYFPAWPIPTNSLIFGFASGGGDGTFTASAGNFNGNGNFCNPDPSILVDGAAGPVTSLPSAVVVAGGLINQSVGSSVTYSLVTSVATNGYDLTNIMVFGGWQDAGRDEQKYQILYATLASPTTFVPMVTADYNPTDPGNKPSVSRTTLVPATGVLAQNVVAIKINWDVSPGPENGWEGYSEFIVQGTNSTGVGPSLVQDITPQTASDVVGGQIILTASFTNATSLQWKKNGTNVSGATTSTLTLNNLSTNDAGGYTLVGSNPAGSVSSGSCAVTVNPTPTNVNNVIVAIATQTAAYQLFTPTWSTNALGASLISGMTPTAVGPGDFTGGTFGTSPPTGGSDPSSAPSVLTDGTFGMMDFSVTTTHLNLTCMGSGTGTGNTFGGQSVTFTLPASPNGYTITNIVTAAGWNDGGRDQQAYTVFYSTLQNPDIFLPFASVNFNPNSPVGYSLDRATITAANGVLAQNVNALRFDMDFPAGENGYSGYSEFAVYGTQTATPPPAVPVITVQHEEGLSNTTFVVETPNLIANQLPTSVGPGVFTLEGLNETNLTDGIIGYTLGASMGSNPTNDPAGPVSYIVFTPTNGTWNLTNVVVYTLHHDFGRDAQYYTVSYATPSAPSTFLPLATVGYNPDVTEDGRSSGNRVQISPQTGVNLATNVAAVKFDFSGQGIQDFAWSDYVEIVLQGTNIAGAAPSTPPVVQTTRLPGGNISITGTGGSPANSSYTVLTSTNLTLPISVWTTNTSGTLVGGAFSNSIPVTPGEPVRFFRVRLP